MKQYYMLDEKTKNILLKLIKKHYKSIVEYEKSIGFKRYTLAHLLRLAGGTTEEKWKIIFSKINIPCFFFELNGKKIVSSDEFFCDNSSNTNDKEIALEELLLNCPVEIRKRVITEFYVNPLIAKKMAESCSTIKECNKIYKLFF